MDGSLLLSESSTGPSSNYDPFGNPPDIVQAEKHQAATSVGVTSDAESTQVCPCCGNQIHKTPLPACCPDEELLFLGVGYSLYFRLAKYYGLLLFSIFLLSGSAWYFISTTHCEKRCLRLFGLLVLNLDALAERKNQLTSVLVAIAVFVLVLYLKTKLNTDIPKLAQQVTCPSQYTIMLQNIPDTEEPELVEWVLRVFGETPFSVNWAYDVQELHTAYVQKQFLVIEVNKNKIRQRQCSEDKKAQLKETLAALTEDLARQDDILKTYESKDKVCRKVGTAFLTFEHASTAERILRDHECSFTRSLLSSLVSGFKATRLLYRNRVLIVLKAPAPREVIWQNLQFSYIRNIVFEVGFITSMVLLLLLAFRVQFWFVNYAYSLRVQRLATGHFLVVVQAGAMSLIILILNCLMRLVIMFATAAKRYYSYTKFQGSFCLYYSLFYIINSCIMVYIVHGQNIEDTQELLLSDIHLIMISNALSEPLFKLVDPTMWYRYWRRLSISRLPPQDNPYTQQYLNKLYEGIEISNADNYQYITRVLFITTWFAHMAPFGVAVSLLGLLMDYWICKGFLLNVYRLPENISEDIAKPSILSLEMLPLVYLCGALQFGYKLSDSTDIVHFVANFFSYGITIFFLLLCVVSYLLFCRTAPKAPVLQLYSQKKLAFGFNYETCNPVTRLSGDIKYLYEAMKGSRGEQESQLISLLISSSRDSKAAFEAQKHKVNRIKHLLRRRLTIKEDGQELITLNLCDNHGGT